MRYRVKSESGGIVDGLGVFQAGEEREFDEDAAWRFRNVRGVALNDAAMPDGFSVTVVLVSEEVI